MKAVHALGQIMAITMVNISRLKIYNKNTKLHEYNKYINKFANTSEANDPNGIQQAIT